MEFTAAVIDKKIAKMSRSDRESESYEAMELVRVAVHKKLLKEQKKSSSRPSVAKR